jgi:SPP1 family predicted phage head-tail adaptor
MLNHRITLLKRSPGQDSAGGLLKTWDDVATIWADVRFQSGAEVLRANAETSVVKASIRIRSRADVNTAMRARYQGIEYDIKSALPDADRQFMFLVCEATR